MNKILCIGEALIDMICTDKGSVLADGNNFIKKPGGAPTNVAAAIGALGGNAWLAAKVGVDPFGNHLVAVMNGFNVDTTYMLQDKNFFTTFAFVSLLENGERDFYFNRGADGQLSTKEIDGIDLSDFAIVHFGSATGFLPGPLQDAYAGLLKKALNENVYISFDPNYRQLLFQHDKNTFIEQAWKFLTVCHFFKVSDEEAMLLTEKENVEDASTVFFNKTKAVFAITLGDKGTILGLNGVATTIPSIPVKATDTTGAGDAFVGALLFQLSKMNKTEMQQLAADEWGKIVKNANKAGAKTCEYFGAMEAFQHLNKDIFNGN
jgi:fructokinase